ncbi:MAG: 4-hydroxythreonine-4-phosphate dehydrogenase PdxA [Candidatus Binatia bacterium]
MKPELAVSMGDPAGIGPEIVVAAAHARSVRRACRIRVYGDAALLELARSRLGIPSERPNAIEAVETLSRFGRSNRLPRPGVGSGRAAFRYLEAAARSTAAGRTRALVTAPINKLWLNRAGHRFDGHTEFLSELAGKPATMMLVGKRLRVVLVTTHLALADVPSSLSCDAIVGAASTTVSHLRRFHGIGRPRVAVAALNPHAGEGGMFGDEEERLIVPAVRRLNRSGIRARGPLPADTLFAAAAAGDYDAVVCMYHDQALIPIKLIDFGRAVNVSMGLPFIRTSPDHGTAYDIAGLGLADPASMVQALLLASYMVGKECRRRTA